MGAGPGGYAAAFYAADRGMKVTLVDPEKNPGGVCVYRGCIPSKALLHVADVISESAHAADFGVAFQKPTIDLNKLRDFKNKVVGQLTSGAGQVRNLRKVQHLQGVAAFRDARTLDIDLVAGKKETLTFEHAIVATGSRPATIPGLSIDDPREHPDWAQLSCCTSSRATRTWACARSRPRTRSPPRGWRSGPRSAARWA